VQKANGTCDHQALVSPRRSGTTNNGSRAAERMDSTPISSRASGPIISGITLFLTMEPITLPRSISDNATKRTRGTFEEKSRIGATGHYCDAVERGLITSMCAGHTIEPADS